jgi:ribosomal protein S12 methylthiotransferase
MAQHKKDGACRRLIVTGCLAERYREELKTEIPEIDAVLGTGDVPQIVQAIGGVTSALGTSPLTFFKQGTDPRIPNPESRIPNPLPTYIYDADTHACSRRRSTTHVKVAEGCDYKCAFCIIPALRGHYRSVRPSRSSARHARWRRAASRRSC